MAIRDSQDVSLAVAQATGSPRDSQDVTLAVAQATGAPRDSQDVIIVLAQTEIRGTVADSQASQTLDVAGSVQGVLTTQAPQSLSVAGAETHKKLADRPSIQLHPLRKPLSFASRPLTQPGKSKASFTVLLTEAGANQAFSMPLGARNQPLAGKVFSFAMGGTMTAGASDGTLVITPFYGASVNGVNLGASFPQAYSAGTTPLSWRLKGEIIFRRVDLTPGACLVVCTGSFALGSSSLVFGSAVPIQIDASASTVIASGALNFAATFAPTRLNATPPTISAKYALLR